MGRITKMEGYLQNNMPIGDEYVLSDQEAADLAAFLLMQDRRDAIQEGTFDWSEFDNVVVENFKNEKSCFMRESVEQLFGYSVKVVRIAK